MRHSRLISIGIAAAAAGLAVPPAVAAPLAAQTTQAQMIVITVTPKDLPPTGEWQFDVTMNTHAAPLDDDLARSAVLIDADGRPHAPLAWRGDAPGGHHRKGVLAFGPVNPRPQVLELRLQRRGEAAPRSFRWTLPAQ